MREIVPQMIAMRRAKALRQQDFQRLAEQFAAGVSEQLFGLGIHQNQAPAPVNRRNALRRRFQQSMQPAFAVGQSLALPLAPGNDFAEDNDPVDFAFFVAAGVDFPTHPFQIPIGAKERIFVASLNRSGQAPPVDFLPALRQFGKHVVVTAADEIALGESVVGEPSPAEGDISHLPVKHRNGGGRVLDEQAQPLLADAQSLLGPPAIGNIAYHRYRAGNVAGGIPEPGRHSPADTVVRR